MFFAGGCDACHMSPDQDDPLKLGGGRELKTPFGSFYPPNISQDAKDGIGAWSVRGFRRRAARGAHAERPALLSRAALHVLYARMTPKDVRDLFAFFKTLPAVPGRVRAHALSFPFNVRRGVGLWQRLFFTPGPLAPGAGLKRRGAARALSRRRSRPLRGMPHAAQCLSARPTARAG